MATERQIKNLKINKMTQAQYNSMVKNADELYLTPIEGPGKFLTFSNISASTWVSDSTYTGYSYKCVLTCNGVTANDYAQVIFAPTEANSGNYANVCLSGTNSVTIYGKVNTSITIPTIVILGA